MLSTITWGQYFLIASLLSGLYYAAVIWYLFRPSINKYLTEITNKEKGTVHWRREPTASTRPSELSPDAEEDVKEAEEAYQTDDSHFFSLVHELMEDCKQLLQVAGEKKFSREELVVVLQQKLEPYHQLKPTAFHLAINNFIQAEVENHCSISLRQSDLEQLWN